MESGLQFTESENRIRKKWLFWTVLLPAFVSGCIITTFLLFGFFAVPNYMMLIPIGIFFLITAGSLYLNYHCAYKKPGTILLLLVMIGIPINLVLNFLKPETLALMKVSVFFSLFTLAMLFFEFIVFYYSYQLRKINMNMQERQLLASPAYINAVSVFSTAADLEKLDEQFTKLRASLDEGSAVQACAKAYDQKKKMLKRS